MYLKCGDKALISNLCCEIISEKKMVFFFLYKKTMLAKTKA